MKWQQIKQLKKVKLEANEKSEMRDFLSVRIGSDARHTYRNSFLHFNLFHKRNMFAGILAFIILLTGGGTSYAAEAAIPGDILYPVKIEVNEKVMTALAHKEEKLADWSARQAERRLEEANKLAEHGRLNSDNSAHLAKQLKKHLEKTDDLVKKLEEKGNIQAAAQINAHLRDLLLAHIQANQTSTTTTSTVVTATTTPHIIVTASTTVSTSTKDLDDDDEDDDKWEHNKLNWGKLQKEIKIQLASSTAWQVNLENKISTSTVQDYFKAKAAAGVKKAAENKLEEVNKYFEHKQNQLSAAEKTVVQNKLTEAKNVKTQADQKLNDKKYSEAFELYTQSMTLAQQAKSLIQEAKKDDITATSTKKWFVDDEDEHTSSTKRISDDEDRNEGQKNKNKDNKQNQEREDEDRD